MTFTDLGFSNPILDALDAMNFEKPTPVQEQAIPNILLGKDMIACAQTGTGKTAAFILPVLERIVQGPGAHDSIRVLVVAPTRELAKQIDQHIEGFSYFTSVTSIPVYGGSDGKAWDQQKRALVGGADIVIATPGRLLSHMRFRYADFSHLEYLILDEADRMLDMGFLDDIKEIISYLPEKRQTLLFSATMPPKIRQLAREILNEPVQINIAVSKPAAGVRQIAYMAYANQKYKLIQHLLNEGHYESVLIFSSTKSNVKSIGTTLAQLKIPSATMHSDLEQSQREEVLNDFRNRRFQVLAATDIMARGIDIDGIDLVINFDVPHDAEDYVHRVGRTARAERKGTAVTFIGESDQRKFFDIENLIGITVKKLPMPEELGEGPAYEPEKQRPDAGRRPGGKGPGREKRPGGGKGGERRDDRPRGEKGERRDDRPRSENGERRDDRPRSENGERRDDRPRSENGERRDDRPRGENGERRDDRPRSENGERGPRRERGPRPEGAAAQPRPERPAAPSEPSAAQAIDPNAPPKPRKNKKRRKKNPAQDAPGQALQQPNNSEREGQ